MRVHHLNCMTFFLGARGVTHCLLVETAEGLLLADRGLGSADNERPPWRARMLIIVNRILWHSAAQPPAVGRGD